MIIQEILTAPSNDPREELDRILAKCCEAVLNGQEQDADFYGMVGACVVCPDGQLIYGVNYEAEDGTRVHAERAALERCANVSPECIIVTTLSPCNRPMDERSGESCEDLLAEYGIEHVYCGYKDPTQDGDDSIETKNSKLQQLCKQLADTFLDEGRKKKRKSRGGYYAGYPWWSTADSTGGEGGDGGGVEENFADVRAKGKITLSTDPNWYGAEVSDYKATGPIVNLSASQLVGFEPDNKMNQPASKANVEKIVAGLKQGAKLPPLLVRKYKNGYQVLDGHHRFWAYKLLGVKNIPAQIVPDKDIEEKGQQGVAEGLESYPEVLYHGSTQEIKGPLTPRQANDIGGHPGSNKNAIYATDDPNFAIAYSLAERGSDTGTFGWKKEPRLIFFGGKIRHGKDVYIHVLPTRDEQGQPLFIKGGADAEWYSLPGVTAITPIKVITEPVDRYLHLLRKPTPEEQKIFQANKAKQDMAENFADGKKPGRKGLAKRSGVNCKQSVTKLRSIAKNSSGEKQRMAHWCANMKSGRKK
jgi:pyrimidine deaminase RibD-like protein